MRGESAQVHPVEPGHGLLQQRGLRDQGLYGRADRIIESIVRTLSGRIRYTERPGDFGCGYAAIALGVSRLPYSGGSTSADAVLAQRAVHGAGILGAEHAAGSTGNISNPVNTGNTGFRHARDIHGDHGFAARPGIGAEEHGDRFGVACQFGGHIGARQRGEPHFHVLIVHELALAARYGDKSAARKHDFGGRLGQQLVDQARFASPVHLIVDVTLCERQEWQRMGQCQR